MVRRLPPSKNGWVKRPAYWRKIRDVVVYDKIRDVAPAGSEPRRGCRSESFIGIRGLGHRDALLREGVADEGYEMCRRTNKKQPCHRGFPWGARSATPAIGKNNDGRPAGMHERLAVRTAQRVATRHPLMLKA